MRLDEAIELGAMASEQAFDWLQTHDGKTCALGAAAKALGVDPLACEDMRESVLRVRYAVLNEEVSCPACSIAGGIWRRFRGEEYDLEDVVIHLNDDHRWSRERIAQWLRAQFSPVALDTSNALVEARTFELRGAECCATK